jgi:hypothetical protein
MPHRAAIALCLITLGAGRAVSAQYVARTFELRARDGFTHQADDGYRRHLDWHAGAGDRWTWYLWEVTNGERTGLYVDGTFAHAWADFDAAVDPRGDAADNALNVDPFGTRGANQVWRLRPELGGAPVDLEIARLGLRTEYQVRADADTAFATSLERLRAIAGTRPYAVYELVSGGERPTYVVWVSAATWADAGAFTDQTAAVTRALATSAVRVRAELWRFRPDLSLCRSAEARCHGTLAPRRAGARAPGAP